MKQPIRTSTNDLIEYRLNGVYHRTDGPARIWLDRTEQWYQNGKRHRTDGLAVSNIYGIEEFWLNGVEVDIMVHFLQRP